MDTRDAHASKNTLGPYETDSNSSYFVGNFFLHVTHGGLPNAQITPIGAGNWIGW